jgi:choline dehydrogenase
MVGGLKFLRRLFAAPALAKHVIAENLPGPGVQSDDELLDYARSNGSTVYHASCSCMMGNHGGGRRRASAAVTYLRPAKRRPNL